ncbi:MAG: hypothetical protein IK075_09020 [Prevotella sp.]|nr:hypothetical protein [Prevotella sp.]
MKFSDRVKKYYLSKEIYESLDDDFPGVYALFGLCNDLAVSGAIQQGEEMYEDLKKGKLREIPDYNTKEVTKFENYERTGKMRHDMRELAKGGDKIGEVLYKLFKPIWDLTMEDLYYINVEKTKRLIELIIKIHAAIEEADPAIFEENFFKLMNCHDWTELESDYQKEKKRHRVTMEWLQEKQEQELQKVLELDIMCHADEPSSQFLESVDYEYHRGCLSCNFKDSDDYKKAYAKFMHYATRKENLIIPDYGSYGKYIALHQYSFRQEQKIALFKVVKSLELIQRDMVLLRPELGKYLGISNDEGIEGSRYFAIYINLLKMFEKPWFKEFRSDKKYNLEWIERFLNDLLRSEWRDAIADEWQKPGKVLSVQGNIIGCLIKADVINGSDLSVASAIINGTDRENKTFATYMGRGKREPYCDWICKYITP